MAFKCIYFKQRLGNLLQCSSYQVMLKVLFFLRYQGRSCISAVRPSVKWGIAVCHAECCMMYLTPWFKQYLRSTDLCLQWSGISCHMEWYQTSYLCQRLSCLSRTSNVYAGREVSSISDTLLLAVIHITDVHVLLLMIQQFLSSCFSVLFSFCITFFISALHTVVLNSVCALIDFCTVFTFSGESSGGLYRFSVSFFLSCVQTHYRLILFYLCLSLTVSHLSFAPWAVG